MVKPDGIGGLQWGDEGKGKITDVEAGKHDVVVRFQGGGNAGHTMEVKGIEFITHYIPSGILNPGVFNAATNGYVNNPIDTCTEMDDLISKGVKITPENLMFSHLIHVILPDARIIDAVKEASKGHGVGSTIAGIGPTYMLKKDRTMAVRMEDLIHPNKVKKIIDKRAPFIKHLIDFFLKESKEEDVIEILKGKNQEKYFDTLNHCPDYCRITDDLIEAGQKLEEFVGPAEFALNTRYDEGESILFEGAQGFDLDIDFGTFPNVTSSGASGMGYMQDSGLAVPINKIGIVKAYTTRVGYGPFPTEQENEIGELLRKEGGEFGATTGRPRRCGWLDTVKLKYALMVTRTEEIALTKLDVLSCLDEIKVRVGGTDENPEYKTWTGWKEDISAARVFEDLPENCQKYVLDIEEMLQTPITQISVGKARDAIIFRKQYN